MKKSFILYSDNAEVVKKLTKEQAGELMFILFDYVNCVEILPIKDIAIDIVFTQIKKQIDRDNDKYLDVIQKRKDAGIQSGKVRNKQKGTKRTSVQSVQQKEQEATDNDNVTDIHNKKNKQKKEFISPSIEEVKLYFLENGYLESVAEKAWKYYSVADWHDSKNKPIKNWKQKMQGVWFKDDNRLPNQPRIDKPYWAQFIGDTWDARKAYVYAIKNGVPMSGGGRLTDKEEKEYTEIVLMHMNGQIEELR